MKLVIHRGSRQIGGSCIEVFSDNTRIILDIGEELPEVGAGETKLSVLPRVEGLLNTEKRTIDAVLISHGHGDHIGLLQYIDTGIPVFIGEGALKIFNKSSQFTGKKAISNPTHYLQSGRKTHIGDFTITPYLVDHSGYDAHAFLIESGNKRMVYTGDFL